MQECTGALGTCGVAILTTGYRLLTTFSEARRDSQRWIQRKEPELPHFSRPLQPEVVPRMQRPIKWILQPIRIEQSERNLPRGAPEVHSPHDTQLEPLESRKPTLAQIEDTNTRGSCTRLAAEFAVWYGTGEGCIRGW